MIDATARIRQHLTAAKRSTARPLSDFSVSPNEPWRADWMIDRLRIIPDGSPSLSAPAQLSAALEKFSGDALERSTYAVTLDPNPARQHPWSRLLPLTSKK